MRRLVWVLLLAMTALPASARAGADTVADLGAQTAAEFAERLWVLPPGGSLLR